MIASQWHHPGGDRTKTKVLARRRTGSARIGPSTDVLVNDVTRILGKVWHFILHDPLTKVNMDCALLQTTKDCFT